EYSGGSGKQRYLTAFEREELEKAKTYETRGHAESSARDSYPAVEREPAGSESFMNRTSVDKNTTLSPVSPTGTMTSTHHRSPRAPALSPAKGDSIEVCQRDREQCLSANDSRDVAVNIAKSDSEARVLVGVETAGAISKSETRTREV